ncbi:M10 family metallopeptidase [Amylibacter sp. IMCC11727]|uniref:M10 family metallopeptidase n=1 Tax=Amylibacter sp. IMCC11727 TaxID=3039851 RepID=UPI00244DF04F|nr:M10 family metallopeptidase [Amylibacter sp. IMCC11727]WGI20622.1 M10 family metallopeptidase [Amylibacter sp. IMCC11727]
MLTKSQIIDAMQFNLGFDSTGGTTANPFRLTYQYANSQPSDLNSQYSGWEVWSTAEKAAYRDALDHIETLINVEFVEVTGSNDPDMNVGKVDFSPGLAGLGGLSYSTSGGQLSRIDNFTLFNNDINMANATNLILHELGHALGMKHPFDGASQLPADQDNNKYTVMSYDRNPENGQDSDAMMLYDVLALQDLWGANTSTSTGNTKYTGSRTDNMDTIWDAGGTDMLNASSRSNDVRLDLREGMFSQFGSYEDVSIAFGTVIENARGGSGSDLLQGNAANNRLFGGTGNDDLNGGNGRDYLRGHGDNDTLKGGAGNDSLRGGRGADTLDGGTGNDRLKGGSGRDDFIFRGNSGQDTIRDFQNNRDTLIIDVAGFDTFDDIRAAATFDGSDTMIDLGNGNSITVTDTNIDALANDMEFI